jgi:hypothetical protein
MVGSPQRGDPAVFVPRIGRILALLVNLVLIGCGGSNTTENPDAGQERTGESPNSVHLAWEAPVRNADGSPLTDLAGYRVYHGRGSGVYAEVLDVGKFTSCSIDGLPPGSWYFAVTAYDFMKNESSYSNEVRADIPESN